MVTLLFPPRVAAPVLLLLAVVITPPLAAQPGQGWSFDGDLRLRGESLSNSFRRLAPDTDNVLVSRLRLRARYDGEAVDGMFEVQDSRLFGDEATTPVGTDDVNALEPLQAWVGWEPQPGIELRLGRQTVDFGSRRLLARNRYRNTANSFTGARAVWQVARAEVQALYLYPDERRPDARERGDVRDNVARLDPLVQRGWLAGVTVAGIALGDRAIADAYLLQREVNESVLSFLDREITTLGGRLRFTAGGWRGDVEAALQRGRSRANPLQPSRRVDHRAWFFHGELRHGLPLPGTPELRLQFDAASGDDDPGDGDSGRFDKLFGARASELGPTGLYGFFDRSNLLSPAASLHWRADPLTFEAGYRAGWLESERDFLPSAVLWDPSGRSGDFLGHQWHARVNLEPRPGLSLQAGAVYLDKGEFARNVPGARRVGNSRYFWASASYAF